MFYCEYVEMQKKVAEFHCLNCSTYSSHIHEHKTMGFSCPDCGTHMEGSDCAHSLSRQKGLRKKAGCTALCQCGYPVNAKQVRKNLFSGLVTKDKNSSACGYVYCETGGGEGHVYYGTFKNCQAGNNLPAGGLSTCSVFEVYSGTR